MEFHLFIYPIGNSIVILLDIESTNELKIITNSFYHYFTNNEWLKLDKIVKMVNSEIIIEYTEFKDKCKNNSAHKFFGNFIKKIKKKKQKIHLIK